MSKNLGEQTILSGSVTQSKNDGSKQLQMMSRSLMTVDELKTMPRFHFIIAKTGANPMKTKLDLFFKWGIDLNDEYENSKQEVREVFYAGKDALIAEIERVEQIVPEETEAEEQTEKSEKTGKAKDSGNRNENFPGGKLGIDELKPDTSYAHKSKGKKVPGCEQDHNKINQS